MVDYTQELTPPLYRNLALNPSGEATIASTFYSSNGTIVENSTAVTPQSGTGVIQYTVTQATSLPYQFGPFGPAGTVHRNAFKIPTGKRVSVSVGLRGTTTNLWVQLQARYVVTDGSSTTAVQTVNLGAAVQMSTSAWSVVVRQSGLGTVPSGATHWYPTFAVTSTNPALTNAAPPILGSKVYADRVFVPDSGADISGVAYVDGDQPGCYWEGDARYSSSRTGTLPAVLPSPVGPIVTSPTVPDPTDPSYQPPTSATPPVTVNPPPPTVQQIVEPRSSIEIAREIVGWRYTPQNLCLKADIQISNLRLNTIDEFGVMWLVSDVEGWWTIPEPDVPDIPRGWFDGSYETRGRYNARVFTITGSFIPTHSADVPAARDRLVRAISLCHRGDWFLTHEDATPSRSDTKGSKVWMSGAPNIQTVNAAGRTDFSIGLRAPDPIKYGVKNGVPPGFESLTLITNNSVYPGRGLPRKYPWAYPEAVFGNTEGVVINYGNTEVFPIFSLQGPTSGPVTVRNADTEQELKIVKQVNAGEVLTINCFTKQVTLNSVGNYRLYLDIDADWIYLQPGANRMYFVEDTPGAERTKMDVQWRSGWIG